jgi:hypothetical protein
MRKRDRSSSIDNGTSPPVRQTRCLNRKDKKRSPGGKVIKNDIQK